MVKTAIIDINSDEYPCLLKQIQNPPKKLYCRGDISLLKSDSVAVVGSRNATDYGRWSTQQLVGRIVKNSITVVSGMAQGIDSCAHRTVLDNGGNTIAVLANGVDICYPKSNNDIYKKIIKKGLVISESEDGVMPRKYSFPLRNRIISGLCKVTVIMEAGLKSGSLITAERAAEQGRTVYAVPGNMNRNTSFGCNKLISDGAYIMVTFDDILREMGLNNDYIEREYKDISPLEMEIIKKLCESGEMSIDELCETIGLPASQVSGLVTVLEIKGYIRTAYGKIFIEN